MTPLIALSSEDEARSVRCGEGRYWNAQKRNLRPRYPEKHPFDLWGGHIVGAGSECGVSVWTGLPWSAEFDLEPPFSGPDVGEDIEVRNRVTGSPRVLRVDEKDFAKSAGRRFVLTYGELPTYELLGWLLLPEGPGEFGEWERRFPERSVWEIPAFELLPMSSFARKRDAA